MGVTIIIDNLVGKDAPLYDMSDIIKPDGSKIRRWFPKSAFLFMDQQGRVWADMLDTVKGIDEKLEMDLLTRKILCWRLSPAADGESLIEVLTSEKVKSLLERIHAGHATARFDMGCSYLGDDAEAAYKELYKYLNSESLSFTPYKKRDLPMTSWCLSSRKSDHEKADKVNEIMEEMSNKPQMG